MSVFINAADAALLMVDHQSGLFQTVKDIDVSAVSAQVTMARLVHRPG